MVTYLEMAVAEAKRKTRVRDAEKWRLIQEAKAARAPQSSTRSRVLRWTGKRLVGVGTYLQNRYGDRSAAVQEPRAYQPVESMATPCC